MSTPPNPADHTIQGVVLLLSGPDYFWSFLRPDEIHARYLKAREVAIGEAARGPRGTNPCWN